MEYGTKLKFAESKCNKITTKKLAYDLLIFIYKNAINLWKSLMVNDETQFTVSVLQ